MFAAVNEADVHHARAVELLSGVDAPITSDHVLVETWLLLNSRLGRHVAEAFWRGLRGTSIRLELAGFADLETAWAIGEEWADQDFSIVDRTSFSVMMRLGVHRVATFDADFSIFRFGQRRERSFEVLR